MHNDVQPAGFAINESARSVFEELLLSGPLSRAELSRRLSLSAASLTKITRPLVDAGYFIEAGAEIVPTAGRPAQLLDANVDFAHFVGVKLTGESLYAVATDARGSILQEQEVELAEQNVEFVVNEIGRVVDGFRSADDSIAGLGISLSGNASRDESAVRNSPFLHWRGVPLASLVTERTGLATVLENDVRALTAAEQWFGEVDDPDSFVLLTFGAGIGCGMVVNGHQIEGRQGASGLLGHLRIDEHGPLCYAGHRGCAHAYATTGGVTRTISAALGVSQLTLEDCVELHRQGHPVARVAFDEAGAAIGTLIATVVNLIGPNQILIAGDGVALYELGEEAARKRMAELLHWTASEVEIAVRPFGFNEWARGAAVVAIQQHVRQLTAVGAASAPQSTRP